MNRFTSGNGLSSATGKGKASVEGMYDQEALDANKAFLKFLVIKPAEADLVIEAWENRAPQGGGGRGHHPPVSEETRALRQSYVDRLQQLRAARKASLRLTHPLSRDTL